MFHLLTDRQSEIVCEWDPQPTLVGHFLCSDRSGDSDPCKPLVIETHTRSATRPEEPRQVM